MSRTNKPSILLVEDEAPMREMLARYLQGKGFELATAADGQAALESLERSVPDLVISDIRMPVMDGLEFVQKARQRHVGLTVIMLTAYASVDVAVKAMRAGAYDYITKPIDDLEHDLYRRVLQALDYHEVSRKNRELASELDVRNAELAERYKQLEEELRMAGVVQNSLLPDPSQKIFGLDYAIVHQSQHEISGDFYDIRDLGDFRASVLVGQVFGRDVPCALLTAMLLSTFREVQTQRKNPISVMDVVNERVRRYLEKGYKNFVTAFYGIVDFRKRRMDYCVASHPLPLLIHYRLAAAEEKVLTGRGNYLGKYKNLDCAEESVDIRKNDVLVLTTERLLQCANRAKETFGIKRVGTMVSEEPQLTAAEHAGRVVSAAERFTGVPQIKLDLTLLVARIIGDLDAPEAVVTTTRKA